MLTITDGVCIMFDVYWQHIMGRLCKGVKLAGEGSVIIGATPFVFFAVIL